MVGNVFHINAIVDLSINDNRLKMLGIEVSTLVCSFVMPKLRLKPVLMRFRFCCGVVFLLYNEMESFKTIMENIINPITPIGIDNIPSKGKIIHIQLPS